jgi:serine/threonine protein kinase
MLTGKAVAPNTDIWSHSVVLDTLFAGEPWLKLFDEVSFSVIQTMLEKDSERRIVLSEIENQPTDRQRTCEMLSRR